MRVLAVNPGSSSLKVAVRDPRPVLETTFDHLPTRERIALQH